MRPALHEAKDKAKERYYEAEAKQFGDSCVGFEDLTSLLSVD